MSTLRQANKSICMIIEKTMVLNVHSGLTCTYFMSGARLACQVTHRVRVPKFLLISKYLVRFLIIPWTMSYYSLFTIDGYLILSLASYHLPNNFKLLLPLSLKTFSLVYWRWHHRYLMDAIRQYGYPDVFITISPYEWTFPTPVWL